MSAATPSEAVDTVLDSIITDKLRSGGRSKEELEALKRDYTTYMTKMLALQKDHECDFIAGDAKAVYGRQAAALSERCPAELRAFHRDNPYNYPLSAGEIAQVNAAGGETHLLPMVLRECAAATADLRWVRSRHIKCRCWCAPFTA